MKAHGRVLPIDSHPDFGRLRNLVSGEKEDQRYPPRCGCGRVHRSKSGRVAIYSAKRSPCGTARSNGGRDSAGVRFGGSAGSAYSQIGRYCGNAVRVKSSV